MTEEMLERARVRAAAVGLELSDERLRILSGSLEGVKAMVAAMERVEIDPTDLALEPFDPAWPDEEGAR